MKGQAELETYGGVFEHLDSLDIPGWNNLHEAGDGRKYWHDILCMSVIVSGAVELDGKRWLHVSCAHQRRMPSWESLKLVKERFIGCDRKAVIVLPCESEYVNQHPNCLHLFACWGGDSLPDFTRGGRSL